MNMWCWKWARNYTIVVTAVRKSKQLENFWSIAFLIIDTSTPPSFKALNMAALYILDKLSEAAGSSLLEDKMKVVFSQARESDEAFIYVLCDLYSALRAGYAAEMDETG
ncbi:hypothetical protein Tco_0865287 [Tanacetum coccineum]